MEDSESDQATTPSKDGTLVIRQVRDFNLTGGFIIKYTAELFCSRPILQKCVYCPFILPSVTLYFCLYRRTILFYTRCTVVVVVVSQMTPPDGGKS